MAHNFQQWWENGTGNIMSIASYKTNSQRKYGVQQRDIASSQLHNRLFYQLSTFTAAFANMMDAKGYALSESNIATLATQLANVMTKYDLDTVYKYATQSWVKSYYGGYGTGISGGVLSYYYTKTQVDTQISSALTTALAPYATKSYVDVTKKASSAEVIAGLLDSKYISPLALAGSIATSAQIIAGSSGYRFMIASQYLATKASKAQIVGAPTGDYSNRWIDAEGLFSSHATAAMINSGSVNYQGYIIDPYQLALSDYATKTYVSNATSHATAAMINSGSVNYQGYIIDPYQLKQSDYATKTWVSNAIAGDVKLTDFTGPGRQRLSENGYQKLPGGIIIQWGRVIGTIAEDASHTISFPIAFSTCLSFTINGINSGASDRLDTTMQIVSVSKSSASVYCQSISGGGAMNGFYWMAVGI